MFNKPIFMYDEGGAGGNGDGEDVDDHANDGAVDQPTTWDDYIAGLPEDQQSIVTKLYEDKNKNLLNTVRATREERDTFAQQLRDAAKTAGKGSDAEKLYTEQAEKLELANKRADFYEAASEHQCRNAKAAFKLATVDDLFDKKGMPDWDKIKEAAPELFGEVKSKPKGKGGAGEGTDKTPAPARTFNDVIRSQAGVTVHQEE